VEATFNFVIETDKLFATTKGTFTRVIFQGGKVADPTKSFEIQN
jgi:hypothetical protein